MAPRRLLWSSVIRHTGAARFFGIAAVALLLAGCGSSPTTPAGPLGSAVDLRSSLPPEVAQKFPTDASAEAFSTTQAVCNDAGQVQLNWRGAADGDMRYIVSFDAAVVQPAPNFTMTLKPPVAGDTTMPEQNKPTSQILRVAINCKSDTLTSDADIDSSFELMGDGSWSKA